MNGYILHVEYIGGTRIQTNDKSLVNGNERRSIAMWEAALRELENNGLVESADHKRQVFKITRAGYDVADKLHPGEL